MSEAQRAMQESEEATKAKLENAFTAGMPSSQAEKSPSNFAWPVSEIPRRVADFSNVHTEYRDNYHEWEYGKSKSARPPSTNPITASSSYENWVSETKQSLADVHHEHHQVLSAGVQTTPTEKNPLNFSWPVPQVTRHVPDFTNNVHTEYRDNFSSWEASKVSLLHLTTVIFSVQVITATKFKSHCAEHCN